MAWNKEFKVLFFLLIQFFFDVLDEDMENRLEMYVQYRKCRGKLYIGCHIWDAKHIFQHNWLINKPDEIKFNIHFNVLKKQNFQIDSSLEINNVG